MSATEQQKKQDNSLDLREKSRYEASLRLSVAPMMDWTHSPKLGLMFSVLRQIGGMVLQFRC